MRKQYKLLLIFIFFFFIGGYVYNRTSNATLNCEGYIERSDIPTEKGITHTLHGYVKINFNLDNIILYLSDETSDFQLLKSAQVELIYNWSGDITGVKVINGTGHKTKNAEVFNQRFNILTPNTVYTFSAKKVENDLYLINLGVSSFFCLRN